MNTKQCAALSLLLLGAVACGDDTTDPGDGSGGSSGSAGGDGSGGTSTTSGAGGDTSSSTGGGGGGGGAPAACREAAPADRDRFVVVGHMFAEPTTDWEVLRLTTAGVLERTGTHFTMGESTDSRIAFTPDGRIGVAAQERGTLGIFRIDDDGAVTVVDAGFGGGDSFFAHAVSMAPDGSHVIVADGNTYANGGGLYRVDLDCETGEPTLVGKLVEVNNAWAATDLGAGRWIVGSNGGALGELDGTDVQDLRAGEAWRLADAVDTTTEAAVFNQIEASRDGSFVVAIDQGLFSDNEATLIAVSADGLEEVDAVAAAGPYDVAIAPDGDVALITLLEQGIMVYDVDAGASSLSLRGELAYVGSNSSLPARLAKVERGSLDGTVLVAELYGVRVVTFDGEGAVTDRGLTFTGGDTEETSQTPSGIGIQP